VNVRIVTATNRRLEDEVARGRFRADLYHRLAVFPLRVPPLRERREDIGVLAAHFADQNRRRLGLGAVRFDVGALDLLAGAEWPGNVRELENVISRAVLRAAVGRPPHTPVTIETSHLGLAMPSPALPALSADATEETITLASPTLRAQVEAFERRVILDAVERRGGNWAAAARDLGMHRSNLHQLARRRGLLVARRSPRG
jgi:anaerobic nitric oxide reductase transcription regulator